MLDQTMEVRFEDGVVAPRRLHVIRPERCQGLLGLSALAKQFIGYDPLKSTIPRSAADHELESVHCAGS